MIILSIYTAEWFLNVLTTQMTSPLRFPQISLPALVFKVSELASNDYQIKNKSGVYAFYCITEHKFYIGSAKCLYKRIKSHIANKDSNRNLQKAFRLFGQNDFFILILVFIKVDSILNIKDIASIALKTKSNVTRGLNNFKKSVAGQSPALTSHHAKHGGVDMAYKALVEFQCISNNKEYSTLLKNMLIELENLYLHNFNFKFLYNIAMDASNPMLNSKHSNETKALLSKQLSNKPKSIEHRVNISNALKGHVVSPETKQLMSLNRTGGGLGLKRTPEQRAQISASCKGMHSKPIVFYNILNGITLSFSSAIEAGLHFNVKASTFSYALKKGPTTLYDKQWRITRP